MILPLYKFLTILIFECIIRKKFRQRLSSDLDYDFMGVFMNFSENSFDFWNIIPDNI